jgi:hypothetical protein
MGSSGFNENDEVQVVKVSLDELAKEFGPWMVGHMDHSGLPLYLILHPEAVEELKDACPIGLEVNLPTGAGVILGSDTSNRGRNNPRVDLIFKKGDDLYLVEIIDKDKKITSIYKKKMIEYVRRIKENLGSERYQPKVYPIIVQPKESIPPL